jgi:tetratricopeptide (TPR) repeat protein
VARTQPGHVDDPKKVGSRLKETRTAVGLSQRALSFEGCTAAYISRIEAGERVPSLQLIHQLARRLRVSAEYLATGVHAESGLSELVEAEVALRLGEHDEAARMFRERLAEDPGNAQALAGIGHVAFANDDLVTAIDLLEQALAARGGRCLDDPGAVEALGRAYAATGALEDAVALLERAADEAKEASALVESVRFQVLLANALIDSGAAKRAEQVLAGTIRSVESLRDPLAVARVYWTQGRLHTHHKDPVVGARYARRALEILERTEDDRYIAMAYQFLAVAENTAGEPEAALEHLAHGRTLFGTMLPRDDAMFAVEETRALLALGQIAEAAARASVALGKLPSLEPGDQGRAYVLLGEVFHRTGDTGRAIELLELAVELLEQHGKPYLLDAASKLADVLEEAGSSDQALAVLRRAVAAGKREPRVRA